MADEKKNPPLATSPSKPDESKKESTSENQNRRTGDEENPDQLLGKVQDILKEYNNEETAIPLDSEYWTLLNRYRAALSKPEPKDKK